MRAVTIHRFATSTPQASKNDRPRCPGQHEVLVEVRAAPVNYVDLVTMRGEYQFVPELPYVPGKGPAGVIRSVGARPARERA
jgi:NADPH2:quinone reductase